MEFLRNKVVCITGASSGIGAACAVEFARQGCALFLSARRKERIDALAEDLRSQHSIRVQTARLDVTDPDDVQKTFGALPPEWQEIQILVNNAGLSRGLNTVQEGSLQDWEEMIDTNIKGLLYVTRQVLPGMVRRNSGHVINIGSIAGHQMYPGGNVYCASKSAANMLSLGMRMDVLGTNVRVSSVEPGLVETEFGEVRFRGDTKRAAAVYAGMRPLHGEDVADIVVFCATRPAHVDVSEVIVMPTDQASVYHVHRKQS